jgi:hypothetical protein
MRAQAHQDEEKTEHDDEEERRSAFDDDLHDWNVETEGLPQLERYRVF